MKVREEDISQSRMRPSLFRLNNVEKVMKVYTFVSPDSPVQFSII
jgi:hypothetical protein